MLRPARRDDAWHEVISFTLHDDVVSEVGEVATAMTVVWTGAIHPRLHHRQILLTRHRDLREAPDPCHCQCKQTNPNSHHMRQEVT